MTENLNPFAIAQEMCIRDRGKATARRIRRAAEGAMIANQGPEAVGDTPAADVTFCGSGNLAQIYFHTFPKLSLIHI